MFGMIVLAFLAFVHLAISVPSSASIGSDITLLYYNDVDRKLPRFPTVDSPSIPLILGL